MNEKKDKKDRKKEGRFTALYAAPAFMQGFQPGPKDREKKDYPNNYDETEKPVTNRVYDAPNFNKPGNDAENGQDEGASGRPAFICVYAGPEWFAARRREQEELEAQKAREENADAYGEDDMGEAVGEDEPGEESPCDKPCGEPEEDGEEPPRFPDEGPMLMGKVCVPPERFERREREHCGDTVDAKEKKLNNTPKFCPACGSATVKGANYCINCGRRLW